MRRPDIPKLIYTAVHVLLALPCLGCGAIMFLAGMGSTGAFAGSGSTHASRSDGPAASTAALCIVIGAVWGAVLGLLRKRLGVAAVLPVVLCAIGFGMLAHANARRPSFHKVVTVTTMYVGVMGAVLVLRIRNPNGEVSRPVDSAL